MFRLIKKFLVGAPLETAQLAHERLPKKKALAVFSSDALSSVAYGTEEILLVLSLAGVAYYHLSLPIAIIITLLLMILVFSYKQTIHAYPSGGGSFIVAKENLGVNVGLVAGAALLIDYVLTVAVSTAAGAAAITSAFPALLEHKEALALVFIFIVTVANLRGIRESANIFMLPTYFFIIAILLLILGGFFKYFTSGFAVIPPKHVNHALQPFTIFLLLRAFASGCTALTGVEAISDGVPAFKSPESKNASTTLVVMAVLLSFMFIGVTSLALIFGISPKEGETVVSQIGEQVFGRGVIYYFIQFSTSLILILAANTSYSDFPRLSSIMAKDGFLPRLLALRGDRLVFSNGIISLGVLAGILIIIFQGETHALIPLYAVGVFISFTLSQSGMVIKWIKSKENGWKKSAIINSIGAVVTGITTVIIASTKFTHGAWVVIVLIPIFVFVFRSIKKHYVTVAKQLTTQGYQSRTNIKHTIIIPIGGLNRIVLNTLEYAKTLSPHVFALHISSDEEQSEILKKKWNDLNCNSYAKLEVVPSPYRSLIRPLLKYIEKVEQEEGDTVVTVLIPEFMPFKWWHYFLHNQTGLLIRTVFLLRKDTVVASVPYHLKE